MVFIQDTAKGVKGGRGGVEVTFIMKQVSSPVFHILYISFLWFKYSSISFHSTK